MGEPMQDTETNQNKWKRAGITFLICAGVSLVGWYPLSLPSRGIRAVLPDVTCTHLQPGTFPMYLCSAKVGLVALAAPVALIIIVFIFRKALSKWVATLTPKMPANLRYLVAPVLATIIFTIAWSGAHIDTAMRWGFLPHIIFPSVIGLFTYAAATFGPNIQEPLAGFFNFRDKFPNWLRIVFLFLVPFLLALLITAQERVTQETFKEQFIVLVALILGYLMMAPRSGDMAATVKKFIPMQEQENET